MVEYPAGDLLLYQRSSTVPDRSGSNTILTSHVQTKTGGLRASAILILFFILIGPAHDPLQAQAEGSIGEASIGLVGGLVAGSLVGLAVSTAEARFFNRYMFVMDAAVTY